MVPDRQMVSPQLGAPGYTLTRKIWQFYMYFTIRLYKILLGSSYKSLFKIYSFPSKQ